MIDTDSMFARQFQSTDGGYLFYPSAQSGGKLITSEEYAKMVDDWRNEASGWRYWRLIGITLVLFCLWALAADAFQLPNWTMWLLLGPMIVGPFLRYVWILRAPHRLVSDRPDIVPPRSKAETRRAGRHNLTWPSVGAVLVISGWVFFSTVSERSETDNSFWLIASVSGALFLAYSVVAILKLRDTHT